MHWPEAKRHADVRNVGAHNLARVEVICGGFPCQDVSQAGKNAGLDGQRSGLWSEFARIAAELRPKVVVVENVRALVSRGLDRVTADLHGLGYRVEGRILAASDVGAPHRRERLFLVARMADADRERIRIVQQREPRRLPNGVRHEGQGEPFEHGPSDGRSTKPGMDRGPDGVSQRVDRWPARPGEPPTLWEPPMSVGAYSPTRDQRNRALGNAVVPQVARIVGERVAELLRL